MIGETTFKYNCKENDNIIRVCFVDGVLDEYLFSDTIDKSQIVIGAKDIEEATRFARKEFV